MSDIAVAMILLAISGVFIVAVAIICRVLGVWKLSTFFGMGDEKVVLTKNEHHYNAYTAQVGTSSSTSKPTAPPGAGVEYAVLRETGAAPQYVSPDDYPPPVEAKDSPASDTVSLASELEVLPVEGSPRLQRAMSCDSVSSDSSLVDIESDVPRIGQLEFGIEYDREVGELVVSVIQAKDLETSPVTNTVDSYVKLWLSPGPENKHQTKTQKDTSHPTYMERFLFSVESDELDAKQVQFQVYSSDKYARHKLLGETEIRLGDVDLRRPIRVWMNLRDMDEKPSDVGDIMFSLSYLPTAERLTVVVAKTRNLKLSYGRKQGDTFVKVYLLQGGKRISKKKTSTKRDECSATFNEAMIFSVPANALQSVQLRLSVMELLPPGDKLNAVGHVLVGAQLAGTELMHWNQMMTSLRKPIAMWHRLRRK